MKEILVRAAPVVLFAIFFLMVYLGIGQGALVRNELVLRDGEVPVPGEVVEVRGFDD